MASTACRHHCQPATVDPQTGLLSPGSRVATHDPRWSAIDDALHTLREAGRCAVRIVDSDCGAGSLLLHALHHARTLGFTAIEGRGIDGSPALIERARAAAARTADLAIGVDFEVEDMAAAIEQEAEFPADILLWHDSRLEGRGPTIDELRHAGNLVIGDADGIAFTGMRP